jgi:hypothetical protein
MRYILAVSSTSLGPDEIRAAAATHQELGPEYQAAVIESFLDKVGREIDARVDARLATAQQWAPPAARRERSFGRDKPFALAVISLLVGIPITGIESTNHVGFAAVVVAWLAIAMINVVYAMTTRPPSDGR